MLLKACLTPSFHPAILTFLKLATNRRVVLKPNTHLLLFLFIMQSQHKHPPPAGRSGPTRTLQQGPHPNSASPRTHIRKHGWPPCHTDGCNVTAICCHISAIHELLSLVLPNPLGSQPSPTAGTGNPTRKRQIPMGKASDCTTMNEIPFGKARPHWLGGKIPSEVVRSQWEKPDPPGWRGKLHQERSGPIRMG